ncbi:hypothetical protein GUJ93_ZPchr0007g6018 [Zizania palustris]|uniref:Uncharacterized protein n=1 Tax=Zizania palustris TaxID=103762 RepID=A0A8J5SUP0_ZIZPA|nr:hypothetical protein GUJ93_ZPchr0007g6018 [Zizania palustris]
MSHIDVLNQFPFTFPVQPPAQNDTFLSPRCFFLESVKLHRKGVWKSECICGPEVTSVKDLRMVTEWNMGSFLCPCTEPENPLPIPLTSWEDYYKWRLLPFESPVAVLLHWIARNTDRSSGPYFMRQVLPVFVIKQEERNSGPEKELLQLSVFGELCALFPGVRIYIELVGPAVPKSRLDAVVAFP